MVGGGRGGLMDGGDHCCISKFMLKSTKSLKDLSKDSNVFLISRLVSMCSAKNSLCFDAKQISCISKLHSLDTQTKSI